MAFSNSFFEICSVTWIHRQFLESIVTASGKYGKYEKYGRNGKIFVYPILPILLILPIFPINLAVNSG